MKKPARRSRLITLGLRFYDLGPAHSVSFAPEHATSGVADMFVAVRPVAVGAAPMK
jgi:hypothetical protein